MRKVRAVQLKTAISTSLFHTLDHISEYLQCLFYIFYHKTGNIVRHMLKGMDFKLNYVKKKQYPIFSLAQKFQFSRYQNTLKW